LFEKASAPAWPNIPISKLWVKAADGNEALRKVKELNPDIVLMDVDMPEMDGLAVTQVLKKEMPHVKVLILSMHRQTESVLRVLQSGALGYVLKDAAPEELVRAIESVSVGESFFSPAVARLALNQFVRGPGDGPSAMDLTNREREVLILIADGLSKQRDRFTPERGRSHGRDSSGTHHAKTEYPFRKRV